MEAVFVGPPPIHDWSILGVGMENPYATTRQNEPCMPCPDEFPCKSSPDSSPARTHPDNSLRRLSG